MKLIFPLAGDEQKFQTFEEMFLKLKFAREFDLMNGGEETFFCGLGGNRNVEARNVEARNVAARFFFARNVYARNV